MPSKELDLPQPESTRGLRVLVVDDNRDAADSIGEILTMLGNEVRVAYDGVAAMAAVTAFNPAVVFLDIGMPRMSGHDVCREIRRTHSHPVMLIALTGFGHQTDRAHSLEIGFDEHLVKPISVDALQKTLAAASLYSSAPILPADEATYPS